MPETRGRKKGSVDQHHAGRQAAIARGVQLVALGKSCVEAARIVRADYPNISPDRMVKLIRCAKKDSHQR
jgi:hypothetical protein